MWPMNYWRQCKGSCNEYGKSIYEAALWHMIGLRTPLACEERYANARVWRREGRGLAVGMELRMPCCTHVGEPAVSMREQGTLPL